MSATGRGTEREEHDNYPTPAWPVHRLLEHVDLPGGYWLEPCAGEGAIMIAAARVKPEIYWHAVEIRPECVPILGDQAIIGDFLDPRVRERALPAGGRFSVAISNPPYSLAMEFLQACLPIANHVVFLLRVGFLESQDRHDFLSKHVPDLYILPNRPAFVGKSTDATTYAWMHWTPTERISGKVEILNLTSKEERRR